MKHYTVYLELFGKKMRTTVPAESLSDAIEKVRNKIAIHKVVEAKNNDFNNAMDILNDIFNPK